MAAAIGLRDDFDGPALRKLGRLTKDAAQARRLLALAAIYDGGSRTDAARIGDVGLQTVRDWVLRFNARGPAGLLDGKAPGNRPKLDDAQRRALAEIVERGPIPAIHEVVRWRLGWCILTSVNSAERIAWDGRVHGPVRPKAPFRFLPLPRRTECRTATIGSSPI